MILRSSSVAVFIGWVTFRASLGDLHAQGVATARISSTVTDNSGAALVSANVQATNWGTGSSRSMVTDSEGRLSIADLLIRANSGQPKFVFIGPTAGQITSLAAPQRQIQFAIRLLF